MTKNTNSPKIGLDYKEFVREFERYRLQYPEASLQQALEAFKAPQNSDKVSALV